MSRPTLRQVHRNAPLSDLSVAFLQNPGDFVGDNVFPMVPVDKKTDGYYVWPKGAFFTRNMKPRAAGTRAARGAFDLSTDSYSVERFALAYDIPLPVLNNQDAGVDLVQAGVSYLAQQVLLEREVQWASNFFSTSAWGTNTTLAISWSNSSGDPIGDVRTMKRTIRQKTGLEPNVMVFGAKAFDKTLEHADIIARLDRGQTPGGPAMASRNALAALFGVDRIMVSKGVQFSGTEGSSGFNSSGSYILNQNRVGMFYVPPAPGLMTPAAGYTFVWRGSESGIMQYENPPAEETLSIEINEWWDQKVVASECGGTFPAATT